MLLLSHNIPYPNKDVSQADEMLDKFDISTSLEGYSKVKRALQSYLKAYKEKYVREIDYVNIVGEENILRYLPVSSVAVRISERDSLLGILMRVLAAIISRVESITLSFPNNFLEQDIGQFIANRKDKFSGQVKIIFESEHSFIANVESFDRVYHIDPPRTLIDDAAYKFIFLSKVPPLEDGSLELLNFLEEQSISHSYHRYGNTTAWILNKE